MKFTLVSPTKKHLDLSGVTWITLPTETGEIGVYLGHVPVVGALKPGLLKIDQDGKQKTYAIGGGVFETDGKHLDVLADMVVEGSEIDTGSLESRKKEAEKLMQEGQKRGTQNMDDYIQAEQELNRINALEQIARSK